MPQWGGIVFDEDARQVRFLAFASIAESGSGMNSISRPVGNWTSGSSPAR
jgi:hypothetical protein